MSTPMKLGDTVTGEYHGVQVTGILTAFDGSGYVYVRPFVPVTVYGSERDEVCFDRYAKADLTVVARGPELTWDDVGTLPASAIGGQYLRRGRCPACETTTCSCRHCGAPCSEPCACDAGVDV